MRNPITITRGLENLTSAALLDPGGKSMSPDKTSNSTNDNRTQIGVPRMTARILLATMNPDEDVFEIEIPHFNLGVIKSLEFLDDFRRYSAESQHPRISLRLPAEHAGNCL